MKRVRHRGYSVLRVETDLRNPQRALEVLLYYRAPFSAVIRQNRRRNKLEVCKDLTKMSALLFRRQAGTEKLSHGPWCYSIFTSTLHSQVQRCAAFHEEKPRRERSLCIHQK